jgi:hypothetical protein
VCDAGARWHALGTQTRGSVVWSQLLDRIRLFIVIVARNYLSGRPTEDDLAKNEVVALIVRVASNMDHIKLDKKLWPMASQRRI